jgi:YVTN family beta-propeller protein
MVYVANQDGTVTVINGATNTPTPIKNVGLYFSQIAVNTTTNMVYVGNNTPNATGIVVINGATNTVTTTVPSVVFNSASWGVAVNSTTNKIYVTNNNNDTVTVIDGVSNIAGALASPGEPQAIAINSAINRVYVANSTDGTVTVIDGVANQTATIAVGSEPSAIGVSASSNLVFVANTASSSLSVIDPSKSGAVAPTVSITYPANGSVVSQTVTIAATASAGLALAGVQFAIDGVPLGSQVTSAPYTMSWNTLSATNGSHVIKAVATDSSGNTAPFSVTVTVANGGAVFFLSAQATSSTSQTVVAGGTARYLLNLISGASFNGTVSLTCAGAPATAVCSVVPVSQSVSVSSTVPVTVTVSTVAQSASLAQPGKGRAPFTFALALLAPFALAGWRGSRRRKLIRRWVIGGFLALTMLLASCGAGGAVPATSFSTGKSTGTATGTYTLTITGTSATVTPTTLSLTLIVD